MTTEGVLMRLNKQDFRELMNAPLLQWVSPAEALAIIERGGRWLDVRLRASTRPWPSRARSTYRCI